MTDPIEQIKPYCIDFDRIPNASAINRTSGGIGKKDASANAITPRAIGPYFDSDHFNTQSYKLRIKVIFIEGICL